MTSQSVRRILTINTGSSSVKAGVYRAEDAERREATVRIERVGHADGRLSVRDADGTVLLDRRQDLPDHPAALAALLACLRGTALDVGLAAIGHRVVHGGRDYTEPVLVSDGLIESVRALVPFDPEHLPQAIAAIEALGQAFPTLPQVACFDTAFHREMPRIAQLYGLPFDLYDEGVLRYGFHGLSYESIVNQLGALGEVAGQRVVIAHLGNGASMAAVRDGRGIETTMGFTPTGGLVMGTRSGDLDPGALLYLMRTRGLDAVALGELLNRQAGMLGVSGIGGDMRDLLAREADYPRAADAVALFCYQARKFLGALVAVLGGLDTLVFTAGIGEGASLVRERICAGFEFLGIRLDPDRNRDHALVISREDSSVTIRVVRTDEEAVIRRHTARLLEERGGARVRV